MSTSSSPHASARCIRPEGESEAEGDEVEGGGEGRRVLGGGGGGGSSRSRIEVRLCGLEVEAFESSAPPK